MVRFNFCLKTNIAKLNSLIHFFFSTSACYWDPEVPLRRLGENTTAGPICSFQGEYNSFSDKSNGLSVHHVSKSTYHRQPPLWSPQNTQQIIDPCDCPCDVLVEVKTPPRSVMALSYIAQALVVTIVGLNIGFRWCVGVSCTRGVGGEGATGTDFCELRLKIILP